jgi:hypothetical protein
MLNMPSADRATKSHAVKGSDQTSVKSQQQNQSANGAN